jgi:hypothetical protein
MGKGILTVDVVEEKGEYRITIAGEKAADVVKMFLSSYCCPSSAVVKCETSDEGTC